MDRPIRVFLCFAHLVHAVRKRPTSAQIGKNDVSIERKESVFELISPPGGPRNMKFHHENVRSRTSMPAASPTPFRRSRTGTRGNRMIHPTRAYRPQSRWSARGQKSRNSPPWRYLPPKELPIRLETKQPLYFRPNGRFL